MGTAITLGLSSTLWPIHPKPLPDELFSCWLLRIARGYAMTIQQFCALIWPGQIIWSKDLDRTAPANVLHLLSVRTGTAYEAVVATTLAQYEQSLIQSDGQVFDSLYFVRRQKDVVRFCPRCLSEDTVPYFRRQWRLAFISVCPRHQCALADCCSECGAFCEPAKAPMNSASLAACYKCGSDLRQMQSRTREGLDTQIRMETRLLQLLLPAVPLG
jgi:hypothetical protein